MGTLKSIAGKNGCGIANSIATGKKGCQIPFGTPKHAIRLKKGTIFPSTTIFNLAFVLGLIQSGKATPVMGATGFERMSGEDGLSTTSDNTERLNVLGLPKYKMTFQEGHEFYRQMSKLTGFKNSDWLIIDDAGSVRIAINSAGNFTGFTAGQVIADQVVEKTEGGDGESKSMTVQFTNRKQWDYDYTIITSDQSQIDWEEVDGVNPTEIAFKSVPSAGDVIIILTALLSSDKDTNVEGAIATNFLITVNGTPVVPNPVDEVSNEYSLTLTPALASEDVITASFNGNINIEDVLFLSNIATETVI
jgi:hypothetical protein